MEVRGDSKGRGLTWLSSGQRPGEAPVPTTAYSSRERPRALISQSSCPQVRVAAKAEEGGGSPVNQRDLEAPRLSGTLSVLSSPEAPARGYFASGRRAKASLCSFLLARSSLLSLAHSFCNLHPPPKQSLGDAQERQAHSGSARPCALLWLPWRRAPCASRVSVLLPYHKA